MDDALKTVVESDPELLIPIILFLIMGAVGVIGIVFGTISSMVVSKEQEHSRREIAAYIAEGSMTPEDGERLLAAGQKSGKKRRRCGR